MSGEYSHHNHIKHCFIALIFALGGCDMVGIGDNAANSRRAPLLNPDGTNVLTQKAAEVRSASTLRRPVMQGVPQEETLSPPMAADYNAVPDYTAQHATANNIEMVDKNTNNDDSFMSRITAGFSDAADEVGSWFSGNDAKASHRQHAQQRYTPPQNAAILQQETYEPLVENALGNGMMQPMDTAPDAYANLGSVPHMPMHEDRAQAERVFNQLEAKRLHAENMRENMVAGHDIEAQMKSARLSGFVETPVAETPTMQTYGAHGYDTRPAPQKQTAVRQSLYAQGGAVNSAAEQPTTQAAPVPVGGNTAAMAAVPQQPLPQPATPYHAANTAPAQEQPMDAYTAEILGERILPLEDGNNNAARAEVAAAPPSPSPPAAAIITEASPQQYAQEPVAVLPPKVLPPVSVQSYPENNGAAPYGGSVPPPLEVTSVPPLDVQYVATDEATPANDAGYGQYEPYPEYSYYEEAAPRLQAPAPVARQTIFLPESRYARRRMAR